MLRKEVEIPLGLSEVRKLSRTTKEKNTYCSLKPNIIGFVCLCSCILDDVTYFIHEEET